MKNLQQTPEGVLIEIQHIKRQQSQGTILMWPCGMGDIYSSLYQGYMETFHEFDLVLYNPRAHGQSQGNYSFDKAVADLVYFLKQMTLCYPIYGIGHSAGGAGILKVANTLPLEKLFLFSPIIHSRQSLDFMYKEQTQYLFTKLFCRERATNPLLWDTLMEGKWLDKDFWNHIKSEITSAGTVFDSVSKSMENIAHPGYGVHEEIAKHHQKTHIFIPQKDLWFSIDDQLQVAQQYNITIATIRNAKNHFFKRKWSNIWQLLHGIIDGNKS